MAWQGWDGNDYEIFLYDGHSIKQLTENTYNDAGPSGGPCVNAKGQVVWNGRPDGLGASLEIFWDNGLDIEQITENSYRDELPQINDNEMIIWRGFDGSNCHIYSYEGVRPTVISSICSSVDNGFELNQNDQVVWKGRAFTGGLPEIFFYDGIEARQITDNNYEDDNPAIGN